MTGAIFNFGGVESMLASCHRVSSANRTKFQARLKNYLRLGFPEGLGEGRGRAAKYLPQHVFLLELALQFAELGVAPFRAVRALKRHMPSVTASLVYSLKEDADPVDDDFKPVILYFDSNALSDLSEPGSELPIPFGFGPVDKVSFEEWITQDTGIRLSVINITGVLKLLDDHLPGGEGDEFFDNLLQWAKREITDASPKPGLSPTQSRILTRFDFARGKPGKE